MASDLTLTAHTVNEDVGSVSEVIHWMWDIPDFFTVAHNCKGEEPIFGPKFSYSGCQWFFALDLRGKYTDGKLMIVLAASDKGKSPEKSVECHIGSERMEFCERIRLEIEAQNYSGKAWPFVAPFDLDGLKGRRSELVPSDTLTVTFHVGENVPEPPKGDTRRLMGLENLSSSFEDLFVTKKKTDATIKVQDKDFPAHKSVLVARSSVFSAMFDHDTSEEQTGVVTVPDCDPDTFQDFLHHLYTGKFDRVTPTNAHHLYVTADKYDTQELKSFCVDHMKQNLTVENVLDVVSLADRYELSDILSTAQDFFGRNMAEVISTSRWRTLFKEDFELGNRLLQETAQKMKTVK